MRLWETARYYRKMKSIKPYDLGKTTDSLRAVKLSGLIKEAREKFKLEFVKSTLDIKGVNIKLTTSKTRFGGERIWLVCPVCQKKRAIVYYDYVLACRVCLQLKYRKQRFKGTIEGSSKFYSLLSNAD